MKKKKRKRKSEADEIDFQVLPGGPEVLESKKNEKRTLFLCYSDEEALQASPDEAEESDDSNNDDDSGDEEVSMKQPEMTSLGTECLRHFQGDYIIHVGELYGDTTSMEQGPWGRSSGAEFQQELAATFHCLLRVSLPNWIHVRDTLSVWKRSELCSIVFATDSDDDDDDDDDDEGDMEVEYRHIPVSERLPTDVAAPCLAHLLTTTSKNNSGNTGVSVTHEANGRGKASKHSTLQAKEESNDDASSYDSETNDSSEASFGEEHAKTKQEKKQPTKTKADSSRSNSSSEEDALTEDYVVEW